MILELNTAVKLKIAKRDAAEDLEIKQCELTVDQIDYYRDHDQESLKLDMHPDVAYEIYKFLKKKYPDSVVAKTGGENYEVVNPRSEK